MVLGVRGLIPGRTGAFSGRTWVSARGPSLAPASVDHIPDTVIVVTIQILSLPNLRTEDRPSQAFELDRSHHDVPAGAANAVPMCTVRRSPPAGDGPVVGNGNDARVLCRTAQWAQSGYL